MKILFKLITILFFICISLGFQFTQAQITKEDWVGRFAMNHDGWEGTLVINSRDGHCLNEPWCNLEGYYQSNKGQKHKVSLRRFSDDWREITFIIYFPNNPQRFDGYFFSHDKKLMAGTSVWQNLRFGFYGRKIPDFDQMTPIIANGNRYKSVYEFKRNLVTPVSPEQDEIVKRKINDNGGVEILYNSGKKEIYEGGKLTIIMPNGEIRMQMPFQVPDLVPPMPNDPDVDQWLEILNSNMDDIVGHLVGGDEGSMANYENSLENYAMVERINQGMKTIGFLID